MRVVVLALFPLLLLGAPVWGQTAEEIDELIATLGNGPWTSGAAGKLVKVGSPAVPALCRSLSHGSLWARMGSAAVLGNLAKRHPNVSGAVVQPLLTSAFWDEEPTVRMVAVSSLAMVGIDLKKRGTVLWSVVPRAFAKEIAGLLLLLAAWFTLMGRFPKHRPTSTTKHLALMAVTALIPVALSCAAVYYAITRDWAHGFLPDTLTLVPFPVAAVLSTALAVTLPAVWVRQRKSAAPEVEPPAAD